MAYYRAFVRGENFSIAVNDRPQKMGFYTNRWVEADDLESAEARVVAMIRAEPKLRSLVLNSPEDPPRIYVEELELVAALEAPTGLAYFTDESSA